MNMLLYSILGVLQIPGGHERVQPPLHGHHGTVRIPYTLNPKLETPNPKPRNIPYALIPKPETRNPKPKNSQGVLFLMSEVPL